MVFVGHVLLHTSMVNIFLEKQTIFQTRNTYRQTNQPEQNRSWWPKNEIEKSSTERHPLRRDRNGARSERVS
jgi:hypothetical protein